MKKIITILAIASLSLFSGATEKQSSWCEGFNDGWKAGYCYQRPNCLPPLAPLCPLPTVFEENNYEGGYNRGFATGLKRRD